MKIEQRIDRLEARYGRGEPVELAKIPDDLIDRIAAACGMSVEELRAKEEREIERGLYDDDKWPEALATLRERTAAVCDKH